MPHIAIISASIRIGRNSHRVALYFKNYLESGNLATADEIHGEAGKWRKRPGFTGERASVNKKAAM